MTGAVETGLGRSRFFRQFEPSHFLLVENIFQLGVAARFRVDV